MVDIARLSPATLEAMAAQGRELLACQRELASGAGSVLAILLAGVGTVYEWQHYPRDDVHDPATHAQYFYHAHPPSERKVVGRGQSGIDEREHGHFHTFLRARGMPPGTRPLVMPELAIADNPAAPKVPLTASAPQMTAEDEGEPWSHLVAISLDSAGRPLRFFTTNRWVTGETWYPAADVVTMLDRFVLGPVAPSPLLNRWLMALLGLYRPQLAELLFARDVAVMDWRRRRRAKVHVFEDRRLEITSTLAIDFEHQIELVDTALRRVA